MKFSVPVPILEYQQPYFKLDAFEEVFKFKEVIFSFESEKPYVLSLMEEISEEFKEKYTIIKTEKTSLAQIQAHQEELGYEVIDEEYEDILHAVGANFEHSMALAYTSNNFMSRQLLKAQVLDFMSRSVLQDLKEFRPEIKPFEEVFGEKKVVFAVARLGNLHHIPTKFLFQFRMIAKLNAREDYEFAVLDQDRMYSDFFVKEFFSKEKEDVFPNIFIVENFAKKAYFRNYHAFNGTNIESLSTEVIQMHENGQRLPLSADPNRGFMYNLFHPEFWMNHLLPNSEEYIVINMIYLSPFLLAMVMLTCCIVASREEEVRPKRD